MESVPSASPDRLRTGEYSIVASLSGAAAAEWRGTAIVLDEVAPRWGQPRKVAGLVNTSGWEDSAHVTRDGEYLFVVYIAVSPSCVFERDEVYSGPVASEGPDILPVGNHGYDLKGTIREADVFGRTNLTGMHTWDDAFFWSNDKPDGEVEITQLAGKILEAAL